MYLNVAQKALCKNITSTNDCKMKLTGIKLHQMQVHVSLLKRNSHFLLACL